MTAPITSRLPEAILRCALACIYLLLIIAPAKAVVGEDIMPRAEWISFSEPRKEAGRAVFRKTFTAPAQFAKAVLIAACDERMFVRLNGSELPTIAGFEKASSLDVTRQLRPGTNEILVEAVHQRDEPAFRLILELASDGGRQSWVVTDGTWLSARSDDAPAVWTPAFVHGAAGFKRWGDVFEATKSIDAYNSWMLARGAPEATDAAAITAPAGFRVERLRSATPDEGSWISLAFDEKGRLSIGREKRGILRAVLGARDVESIEVIDDTLLEPRGLLHAHGALYVNANNSKGLYRLRDTDGDDRFDERTLLLTTGGGVGHGRNQLRLGPDGLIYVAHGNDVELPQGGVAPGSPLRRFAADVLHPLRWGEHGQTDFVRPPYGHILAIDRDGKSPRLIAGGLRNALDVAFDERGELFTYDADNERDIATPWYKPTRVLHVLPGADFGWRPGAGKWPAYYPDSRPSVVDIGVGSPCGIEFGTRSHFPEKWRRALFIADWAYGRIVAVHVEPEGASWRGRTEPFLNGRPLNVTDLTIGPDGAMYFVTGGRGTQAGLYRVSFDHAQAPNDPSAPPPLSPAVRLRRSLEESDEVDFVWTHLASADGAIRHAARISIERQPTEQWKTRVLTEGNHLRALTGLLALSRVAAAAEQSELRARLQKLGFSRLPAEHQLTSLRTYALSFLRSAPDPEEGQQIASALSAAYPSSDRAVNHELCRALAFLNSPDLVPKTCQLLSAARAPEDLLHYLWHLRLVRDGWNPADREVAFTALRRAEQEQGARDYYGALSLVRKDMVAALSDAERAALAAVVEPAPAPAQADVDLTAYGFVKAWKLEDFSPHALSQAGAVESGRAAFVAAQCIHCHRAGGGAGGVSGPDLAGVGARFGRRDLLAHTLEPSRAIDDKFRDTIVTLKDGTTYAGALEREDEGSLFLSIGFGAGEPLVIEKAQVQKRELSVQSPMPAGLLNILNEQQVIDLLTFLESDEGRRSDAN